MSYQTLNFDSIAQDIISCVHFILTLSGCEQKSGLNSIVKEAKCEKYIIPQKYGTN